MSLPQLTVDALTVVFAFLAPCDLTTCCTLDRRTHKVISTPTQRDSFVWRSLAARLLQQHHRLPFLPPPPLVLSPYMAQSVSYQHVLAFTTPWPIGFATLPLVTAPGHRHEMLVEGEWTWDEVQHEHSKLMRAVEESREKGDREDEGEAESKNESDEEGEESADEAMEETNGEGEGETDEEEEEEEEEWKEGDEEDGEFDDNEGEDGAQEEDEEDEGEEDEEQEDAEDEDEGTAAQQPRPAAAPRYMDLRAVYHMLDVLDSLTRNIPPQQREDDEGRAVEQVDDGPMMVRDRREFHRFFGRVFRMQGSSEDEVAQRAEAFMAQRRRAEEERRRRQERRQREDERRQQRMQRAFVDVGALMDADDDDSRRARRQQQRKLDKQQRRWRDLVDAAMTQRRGPTYSTSEDEEEDGDDEKYHEQSSADRTEQAATRLRYSNNTHGYDRAVMLDRPFPMRLADHAVPFTVVELVTRDRLESMLREQEREELTRGRKDENDDTQKEAESKRASEQGKEEKQEDETSRKRKNDHARTAEEKKQKVDSGWPSHSLLALTRTRSLSNLSSPYYTLCRLSFVAYFEVHIEQADAAEVNRRELRLKEERDKRKRERQALREQRLTAGEEVAVEEEEGAEEDVEHRFSTHPDCVSVGVATSAFSLLGKQPGWDRHSYGYHGDDGAVFHSSGSGSKSFGPTFGVGDVVGCGLDYRDGSVFFTKNGRFLGVHPSTLAAEGGEEGNGLLGEWYGVVGLDSGSVVRVSVAGPWVFDVASYERHTGKRQRERPVWEVEEAEAGGVLRSAGGMSLATAELKRLWRIETRKRRSG